MRKLRDLFSNYAFFDIVQNAFDPAPFLMGNVKENCNIGKDGLPYFGQVFQGYCMTTASGVSGNDF